MMSRCIVLLGKEPIAGQVKTRLAKDIGFERAAEIQHQLTLECIRVLQPLGPNYFSNVRQRGWRICQYLHSIGSICRSSSHWYTFAKDILRQSKSPTNDYNGNGHALFNIREIERALLESKLVIDLLKTADIGLLVGIGFRRYLK